VSNLSPQLCPQCDEQEGTVVARIIRARAKDLGGFSVRRVLPFHAHRMVGPWIFFDHMGPATFDADGGINVRPHPHIGLATVTWLFDGEVMHRDSLGNARSITPGAVNLMIAGKGIVHSERKTPHGDGFLMEGLQLWQALPQEAEEMDPEFHHYPAEAIPQAEVNGVSVAVIIGEAYGVTSPVKSFSRTLYMTAQLRDGRTLALPQEQELAVYVLSGALEVGGCALAAHEMAVLKPGTVAELTATADARIAVVGGDPVGERFVEWNFVSSDKARIEQARADWQAGAFPLIPGDDEEFIPLPE
jgi:redox-sensitive bicupin YhaK (pirin superfamily)